VEQRRSTAPGWHRWKATPIIPVYRYSAKRRKNGRFAFPVPKIVTVISGTGLSGTVEGKQLFDCEAGLSRSENLSYDKNRYQELAQKGNSVSYLIVDNEVDGIVAQGDEIKEEAKKPVDGLKTDAYYSRDAHGRQ
jgi:Cu2+-exporting ATPase